MLLVEYREHDGLRYRVWTPEDAAYGSFKVVTPLELRIIVRACTLMGGLCRPARDAHINPIDMRDFHPGMLNEIAAAREQIGST